MLGLRFTDESPEVPVSYKIFRDDCSIILTNGSLKATISGIYDENDSSMEEIARAIEHSSPLKVELILGESEKVIKTIYAKEPTYRVSMDVEQNHIAEVLEVFEAK